MDDMTDWLARVLLQAVEHSGSMSMTACIAGMTLQDSRDQLVKYDTKLIVQQSKHTVHSADDKTTTALTVLCQTGCLHTRFVQYLLAFQVCPSRPPFNS